MATNDANSRINLYWEKWGAWIATLLLTVLVYTFHEQKTRIDKLEANVQELYMLKASKEDLKEFEARFTQQTIGIKTDILERLDFYFNTHKTKSPGSN